MPQYRLNKDDLMGTLRGWSRFLNRKVRLIACGGTAMTLLGVKESTKDVDFMVPDLKEHKYLTGILEGTGYRSLGGRSWAKEGELIVFDLYAGNFIHTTELLESPLDEGNHIPLEPVGNIQLGILNYYDLICSKLFRGTSVDFDDCLSLVRAKGDSIDKEKLAQRYRELCSYDISEDRIKGHMDAFLERWREGGPDDGRQ